MYIGWELRRQQRGLIDRLIGVNPVNSPKRLKNPTCLKVILWWREVDTAAEFIEKVKSRWLAPYKKNKIKWDIIKLKFNSPLFFLGD